MLIRKLDAVLKYLIIHFDNCDMIMWLYLRFELVD